MSTVIIYHNPRCSKSRAALEMLNAKKLPLKIIDYLHTPLSSEELNTLLRLLNVNARAIMRDTEDEYRKNNLADEKLTEQQLLQAIINFPILLQRPIVIYNQRALIARPPELVLEIL